MSSSRARRATATDYRVYATGRPRASRADAVAGHFEATGRMYRSPFTDRRSSADDVELLLSTAQMPRRNMHDGPTSITPYAQARSKPAPTMRRMPALLLPLISWYRGSLAISGSLASSRNLAGWFYLYIHSAYPRYAAPVAFFFAVWAERSLRRACSRLECREHHRDVILLLCLELE